MHIKACDAASPYHCPFTVTGSNIPKWDLILNCCSGCPRMNAPYLESSEQLDHLFPASVHKIKIHLFQNISKYLILRLRPVKCNNTHELCDNMRDKYKRG